MTTKDSTSGPETFQSRVDPWLLACFGEDIARDAVERNHRFLEESLELVQALGCTQSEAHQLVDYTFNRPTGDASQEVGGVMVTLAALCLANNLDMHVAGETELARIWTKVETIRAKQAAKPKHSPLPEHAPTSASEPEPEKPELLPCPFCSRKGMIEEFFTDDLPDIPCYVATCEICPVKTYDQSAPAEAARIWNTRSPSDAVDQRREAFVPTVNQITAKAWCTKWSLPEQAEEQLVTMLDHGTAAPHDTQEQWRPISSAPKDGTRVLVVDGCVVIARWYERSGKWREDDGDVVAPTLWMPLPAPPTGENQ